MTSRGESKLSLGPSYSSLDLINYPRWHAQKRRMACIKSHLPHVDPSFPHLPDHLLLNLDAEHIVLQALCVRGRSIPRPCIRQGNMSIGRKREKHGMPLLLLAFCEIVVERSLRIDCINQARLGLGPQTSDQHDHSSRHMG